MRNKLAKNSIAVGLVTLIITAGLSFSAKAHPTTSSHSTLRRHSGTGLFSLARRQHRSRARRPPARPSGATAAPAVTVATGSTPPASTLRPDGRRLSLTAPRASRPRTPSVAGTDVIALDRDRSTWRTCSMVLRAPTPARSLTPSSAALVRRPCSTAHRLSKPLVAADHRGRRRPVRRCLAAASRLPSVRHRDRCGHGTCDANPTTATGNGTVAGIDLNRRHRSVDTHGHPALDSAPLPTRTCWSTAPQQLVDDILEASRTLFGLSLGGALAGAEPAALSGLKAGLIDPMLDCARATLLEPLGDLLKPIVDWHGQQAESVWRLRDAIEVTALELHVLGEANARPGGLTCGPEPRRAADDDDTPADDTPSDDTPSDDTPSDDTPSDDTPSDPDAAADADSQADADVTTTLPATGSPNLLPFWMLGLGLLLFGATVLLNEKRRLQI